ncbi:MAG: glycoside hydrolase family 2 TIM barrel-domain containing protein [Prevotella sp.]|nr:glycoside hydrolase family 2 TIM barrel-domain containing protein [Prevotella sp.]
MKLKLMGCLLMLVLPALAQQHIDLSGEWQFSSERETGVVRLPGSMLTNGKGDEVTVNTKWTSSLYDSSYYFNPYMARYRQAGQMKFPFFLTPDKHYVGNAWYERTVTVPKRWKGQPVMLYLERPHIETTVMVNGQRVGHQQSLSVPHVYDVTPYIKYGKSNQLTIQVYNGIENVCVGQDSHSVTDQTQGNWNGIVGKIELRQGPHIWRKRVVPDMQNGMVDITINETTYRLPLGSDTVRWDEFHPQLYTRTVNYQGTSVDVTFGLRELKIDGARMLINNHPMYLRGTVGNCCFPETGYPPTDEASWERVLGQCKAWGINHIRFHSYCPPEAAFAVADRLGLYLQPEGPSWPNHGVKLRSGMAIDQYLMDEGRRMIDAYGHHPSFCMMAAGNEPAGNWVPYTNEWVQQMKAYDPTRLYCGASVGGGWAWDDGSEYHVKAGARGLDWDKHAPSSDDDYYQQLLFPRNYKSSEPNNSPIIAHEQGQWCAFPDFKEIPQYTGAYKARNFEIFRDLLADNGMASQAEKFLQASGRLQTLCYKYEIERNLRTKDYAGFQLLGLNDYSGQGTALVGVLNVHWLEKGYCSQQEWAQFCSPIVPLAKFPKFVYTNNERLEVPIEVYNASAGALHGAQVTWRVAGHTGTLPVTTIPLGKNIQLGKVQLDLAAYQQPTKLTLQVAINGKASNQWDFWVYPNDQNCDKIQCDSLFFADTLDAKALQVLAAGGDVLLTAAGKIRYGNDVKHTFLPVFWNTSWFKMRPPHTTGAYIQSNHPVFGYFPTDDWQNLNWWELTNRAQVINMAEFPADYQPIVQPIDTWHVSRKLGMLLEARVLNGRLLMTTMDITRNLDRRPVARQLRYSILRYMASDDFKPAIRVAPEVIQHLFEREAPRVDMFTKESPDELKPKLN